MTSSDDYMDEMSVTRLDDREIELLLSGSRVTSTDLAELERFVAALSAPTRAPRDIDHMATSLAASARNTGRRPRRAALRRLVTLTAAGAIFVALSGVALAADGSVPGDALYGVDRALERLGIGAGGVDERIEEFDVLVADGEEGDAYGLLAEVIESGSDSEVERAQRHLELAATKTAPSAVAAQEKVAALQELIEQNRGEGVGLDGKDFGQAVSDIARSKPKPNQDAATTDQATDNGAGKPDNVGNDNPGNDDPGDDGVDQPGSSDNTDPKENQGQGNPDPGPPDDAGPPDTAADQSSSPPGEDSADPGDSGGGGNDSPGPPDHAGPKPDKDPGPPDHAGPKP